MEERIRQVPKKCTIVKSRLGVVKTSCYNLPDSNHTYGYKPPDDIEGAGDIISNWVTTNPSSGKESTASCVHQNILAISKGCISAASMRNYRINHPNIRLKEVLQANSARPDSMVEGPFGRKTEYSKDSLADIIGTNYTNYCTEDVDYPILKGFVMHGYMPAPRGTKSSTLQAALVKQKMEAESTPKEHFTMKRFQNIPGKLNLGLKSPVVSKNGPASP